jgi:hypothetical protein
LPSVRATLQLNHGDPSGAVESLESTIPYELSTGQPIDTLHPIFVRGRARLMLHQGPEALAEFQRALDHRSLITFTLLSLVHLQLGRAYAESKEIEKAQSAYDKFFSLWKDADPNNPLLIRAKAEYADLKRGS